MEMTRIHCLWAQDCSSRAEANHAVHDAVRHGTNAVLSKKDHGTKVEFIFDHNTLDYLHSEVQR
jgi:hypothetical protein